MSSLRDCGVLARRYFYPSLESVTCLDAGYSDCPESSKLAERILCLPIYSELSTEELINIAEKVLEACE
jgi:dTDP-4-amino-4,6-dideoxygalactose transaminase